MHRIVRIASENSRVPTKRGVIHRGVGTADRRARRAADAAVAEGRRKRPLGTPAVHQTLEKGEPPRDALARPRSFPLSSRPRREGACPQSVLQFLRPSASREAPARSAVRSAASL